MSSRASRRRTRSQPQKPAWPTFRRAVGLLWPHRLMLAGFFLVIILSSLVGLVPPLVIRRIIDHSILEHDRAELNLLVLVMLAAMLLGGVGSILQGYLSNVVSQTVVFDVRGRLYRKVAGMSLGWFTRHRTGETLSRINNDVGAIQSVISDTMGSIVSNVITFASTFAIMLILDWRLALFAVAFVPLMLVPAKRVGDIQRALQRETQEQLASMSSQVSETLSVSGALLMKTFGREKDEFERFRNTTKEIRDLSIRRAMVGRWFSLTMRMFSSLGPAVVYWYGGHRVIGDEASLGTVVALAGYFPRLLDPARSLISVNISILSSLALFERIFEYLDMEPEITDRPGAVDIGDVEGEIELRDVGFAYVDGQPVLQDVSFRVPPGTFAALVGATGAGKTTLSNLVLRLYDVNAGRVLIDGHDVRDVTLESLSRCIGVVDQEPFLFHASIWDNLRYAKPDASDVEVGAAAHAANIDEFIARLPEGYETVVGERGHRLSGGEKQRVAIARALLKDPAILVLDEATSNLDSITERAIQEALERAVRGRTVLAIAHRLSTVLAADLILVVKGGRVVESGKHADLVKMGGHYARLFEQQFLAGQATAGSVG